MKTLLFIPCFNCAKQIPRIINQLTPEVQSLIDTILLVDNRSTDGTLNSAKKGLKKKLVDAVYVIKKNDENYGLGGSHKVAFNYAIKNKFENVVVLHGDDQANINDFVNELKSFQDSGFDCILGSRFMDPKKLSGYSKFRTFGNYFFNVLFSILLWRKIYDLGSGLNLFKVSALNKIPYKLLPDDLTFNYSLSAMIVLGGLNSKFVPITWREQDQISNVKIVKQVYQVLKILGLLLFKKSVFLNIDQRSTPRSDYPSKTVAS